MNGEVDHSDTVNGHEQVEAEGQGTAAGQSALASLFPNPPIQFAHYTRDNVYRFRVLKKAQEGSANDFDWDAATPEERLNKQTEILNKAAAKKEEQKEDVDMEGSAEKKEIDERQLLPVPDWDVLLTMQPPRVDWIEEDGFYTCFGETWPVEEKLAPLPDLGMRQFYPEDGHDRRAVMVTLLRTILKSYLSLVDVLLEPPQEYLSTENEVQSWRFVSQDKAKDINDLSINFMHLLNETRPIQAKEDLRDMMQKQLDRRREETQLIKLQCKAMRSELAKIREASMASSG